MANLKIKLTGDWDLLVKTFKKGKVRDIIQKAITKGLKGCAKETQKQMKITLLSGRAGGPKLHPFTVAKKGRKKKLVDTGALVRAIKIFVESKNNVFVGIKAGKKGSKGKDLALIANIHESGMTQKVTRKMRAFLHYQGFHLKKSTKVLRTPARPFIAPSAKRAEKPCLKMMVAEFERGFNKAFRGKATVRKT